MENSKGVHQNLRKKRGFPGGINAKKIKGGRGKFDEKSRGFGFKKMNILNREGFFF